MTNNGRRAASGPVLVLRQSKAAFNSATAAEKDLQAWARHHAPTALLAVVVSGLLAGGAAQLLGAHALASAVWTATTVAGLLPLAVRVVRDAMRRQLGVDLIALLAMAGALALRESLAGAVIAVMLSTGRSLEAAAVQRAEEDLRSLVSRAPRAAHRSEAGELLTVPVEEVQPGELLAVRPGEIVPVDGLVNGASATIDESALTGEARPVERRDGERVSSGTVNAGGPFELRATATAADSAYAGVVRLVEEARRSKAPMSRLADRYALAFVPLTLALAVASWALSGDPVRALAVLVVATPCPLILAVPVAFVSGLARSARRGVVVKGAAALEALGSARVMLLDKTGTLTQGRARLTEIVAPADLSADELLLLAASVDQLSPHVFSSALVQGARQRSLRLLMPTDVVEAPGEGIRGRVGTHRVAVGRAEWVCGEQLPDWARRLRRRTAYEGLAAVFVAVDGRLAGALVLEDPIRPDMARTVRQLRRAGIERIVMVTGDHPDIAETVGASAGVDQVLAERTPADKLQAVLMERERARVVMVGDGINDAPALAAADVGVAIGARGATASSEAADVVLVADRLDRLAEAVRIARRTRRIALQSVVAGMGMSLVAMVVAAFGGLRPVAGAVLQEGIDAVVILNALRAARGAGIVSGEAHAALGRRFQAEHVTHLAAIDRIRTTADRLGRVPSAESMGDIREVHRFLVDELLPHEWAEETVLYPVVARLIGGDDPTQPMARAHVEIAHLTRLLGRELDELPPSGPQGDDLPELRRLLYGLHATLRLHMAQEEEAYLSLANPAPPAAQSLQIDDRCDRDPGPTALAGGSAP